MRYSQENRRPVPTVICIVTLTFSIISSQPVVAATHFVDLSDATQKSKSIFSFSLRSTTMEDVHESPSAKKARIISRDSPTFEKFVEGVVVPLGKTSVSSDTETQKEVVSTGKLHSQQSRKSAFHGNSPSLVPYFDVKRSSESLKEELVGITPKRAKQPEKPDIPRLRGKAFLRNVMVPPPEPEFGVIHEEVYSVSPLSDPWETSEVYYGTHHSPPRSARSPVTPIFIDGSKSPFSMPHTMITLTMCFHSSFASPTSWQLHVNRNVLLERSTRTHDTFQSFKISIPNNGDEKLIKYNGDEKLIKYDVHPSYELKLCGGKYESECNFLDDEPPEECSNFNICLYDMSIDDIHLIPESAMKKEMEILCFKTVKERDHLLHKLGIKIYTIPYSPIPGLTLEDVLDNIVEEGTSSTNIYLFDISGVSTIIGGKETIRVFCHMAWDSVVQCNDMCLIHFSLEMPDSPGDSKISTMATSTLHDTYLLRNVDKSCKFQSENIHEDELIQVAIRASEAFGFRIQRVLDNSGLPCGHQHPEEFPPFSKFLLGIMLQKNGLSMYTRRGFIQNHPLDKGFDSITQCKQRSAWCSMYRELHNKDETKALISEISELKRSTNNFQFNTLPQLNSKMDTLAILRILQDENMSISEILKILRREEIGEISDVERELLQRAVLGKVDKYEKTTCRRVRRIFMEIKALVPREMQSRFLKRSSDGIKCPGVELLKPNEQEDHFCPYEFPSQF